MIRYHIPLLFTVLLLNGCTQEPPGPPNILMIVADDMAWDDCGAYGHPGIQTPNIDRLASEGMRFDNAFLTISSCSPSRASIITGKYPHNTGAEQLHWPVPYEEETFVELLRRKGYWTAAAGKWHLGDAMRDRFDLVNEAGTQGFMLKEKDEDVEDPDMHALDRSGCGEWLSTLRERPGDKPFFVWLAALDPHRDYEDSIISNPHRLADVRVPPYLPDVPDVRKDLALYYDEISRLDSYVGLVLEELEKNDLSENTLVLFMTDNGRPFPRDKTTLYDGGIKSPFIIRWPATVDAGSVSKSLISSVDIAPALLEIAGVRIPKQMEGESFADVLSDPAYSIRQYIFAEDHWHDYEDLCTAVRSKDYKLILNHYPDLPATPSADAGRSLTGQAMIRLKNEGQLDEHQQNCYLSPRPEIEFYDINTDPFELNNLAEDMESLPPEVLSKYKMLRKTLDSWTIETGFSIPPKRTPDEFDRETGQPTEARIRPRPDKKWFIENYGIR